MSVKLKQSTVPSVLHDKHLNIRFLLLLLFIGLVFVVVVFCVSHYAIQARLGLLVHLILLPQRKYLELEMFDTQNHSAKFY